MENYKRLAALCAVLALSACSVVTADENGIEIRHAADNDLLVQSKAEKHCAAFGKAAVRVQESSIIDAYIVRTLVSTYKCVPKAVKPAS